MPSSVRRGGVAKCGSVPLRFLRKFLRCAVNSLRNELSKNRSVLEVSVSPSGKRQPLRRATAS